MHAYIHTYMQSIRTYVRTYIYIYICVYVCVHISTNKVPLYHTTLWLYVIYVSLEACDANNELCRLQTGSSFARVLWHWPDLTTPGGVLAADCQPVVDVDGTELRQSWRCGKRAIWCVAIRSSRSPVANWVSHWVPNDRSMVDLCCFVLLEGSSREEQTRLFHLRQLASHVSPARWSISQSLRRHLWHTWLHFGLRSSKLYRSPAERILGPQPQATASAASNLLSSFGSPVTCWISIFRSALVKQLESCARGVTVESTAFQGALHKELYYEGESASRMQMETRGLIGALALRGTQDGQFFWGSWCGMQHPITSRNHQGNFCSKTKVALSFCN